MQPHNKYALTGVLLGLGAPLGSLTLRVLVSPLPGLLQPLTHEWQSATYYYLYMAIGTTLAFGLFGYVLGRLNQQLQDLSITDGLTGLFNHRYMQEHLSKEVTRSDRYKTPLTCLMLDIDDFKKVNDQHGHPFGDSILTQIARLIKGAVRETDLVGRYGGEEFLIIMPQTKTELASALAERILSRVSQYPFKANDVPVHVTLSIGLATYPAPEEGVKTKNGVLSAADQALYQAKLDGKNQAKIWKP